ncbi:hypothetical protein BDK51DRAFT_42006 [Blyttiomyces helicus]|uniref:Autophagy-related protein 16 domain-containing protein n=1 Tax=Blyttiomyces helicus TaxID=388810 RepID=A0A4P9WRF6_9FUNG|nr:hypothetical protein BDK51DRAFT_42006 [Blyttiomyces helicus]|eukprot:RKO94448.1 hypothetical protein BDK51DRAFT_42006 [Blyttiomyces helicus]
MATLSTAPMTLDPWRSCFVNDLAARDRREKAAFVPLFAAPWEVTVFGARDVAGSDSWSLLLYPYFLTENAVLQRLSNQTQRAADLENQLSLLRVEHANVLKSLASSKEHGSPEAIKRFADLELQLSSLKDERADLYKTQGQNAQRVLELMETVRAQEDSIGMLQGE